jgi:hypothetical protein
MSFQVQICPDMGCGPFKVSKENNVLKIEPKIESVK